jgi:hypothetical protein
MLLLYNIWSWRSTNIFYSFLLPFPTFTLQSRHLLSIPPPTRFPSCNRHFLHQLPELRCVPQAIPRAMPLLQLRFCGSANRGDPCPHTGVCNMVCNVLRDAANIAPSEGAGRYYSISAGNVCVCIFDFRVLCITWSVGGDRTVVSLYKFRPGSGYWLTDDILKVLICYARVSTVEVLLPLFTSVNIGQR